MIMKKDVEKKVLELFGESVHSSWLSDDPFSLLKELESISFEDFTNFREMLLISTKIINDGEEVVRFLSFSALLKECNIEDTFFEKLELLVKTRFNKINEFFENEFLSFIKGIYKINKDKFKNSFSHEQDEDSAELILVQALDGRVEEMANLLRSMLLKDFSIEKLRPLVNDRDAHYLCGLIAAQV